MYLLVRCNKSFICILFVCQVSAFQYWMYLLYFIISDVNSVSFFPILEVFGCCVSTEGTGSAGGERLTGLKKQLAWIQWM